MLGFCGLCPRNTTVLWLQFVPRTGSTQREQMGANTSNSIIRRRDSHVDGTVQFLSPVIVVVAVVIIIIIIVYHVINKLSTLEMALSLTWTTRPSAGALLC